jgi:catechol 2,3-dioxygenase-like lactoylglutathione lyase family enzyme
MKPQLTHIALHVADLEACVRFYCQFCQLEIIHRRKNHRSEVIWLAEAGRAQEFVMVLLGAGPSRPPQQNDFSHLGFAVASKDEVDAIAKAAKEQDVLVWPPVQEPFPVGYYCGLVDPNGNYVEFSYGQPLGPGAEQTIGQGLN